jgi:tripartite-type tricarboxylate transporter receptor subunit TctC
LPATSASATRQFAEEAINAGLADPKTRAQLEALVLEPLPMTPAKFGKFVADETEKLAKVVKLSGAKPD